MVKIIRIILMKNQERCDMRKKIILLLCCSFLISNEVLAEEVTSLNLEENLKIKYLWYTYNRVEGTYYQKGKDLSGYIEDSTNITYGDFTEWSKSYCNYSKDNYIVEYRYKHQYQSPNNTRYIRITNFADIKSIKVYSNMQNIPYDYLKNNSSEITIDLKNEYLTDTVWIYIDTANPFEVSFLYNKNNDSYSAYKSLPQGGVYVPDNTWLEKNNNSKNLYEFEKKPSTDLKKYIGSSLECRVSEIKTYRYKLQKNYYDDNYYEYIEGYFPDTTNYLAEYNGEIPEKIVTQTITKDVPVTEYVYLDGEKEIVKEDCSNPKPNVKTKYIENDVIKEVYKIPKKVYFTIAFLIITILFELLIMKKKSNETFS